MGRVPQRPRFARTLSSAGFTLVELLLVVVVLASIAAIAMPRLESLSEAGAEDRTLRLFGGAAIRAQDLALRHGRPVPLVLDLDARTLTVGADDPVALPTRSSLSIAPPDGAFVGTGRFEAVVERDGLMPALLVRVGDRPVRRLHPFTADLVEVGTTR